MCIHHVVKSSPFRGYHPRERGDLSSEPGSVWMKAAGPWEEVSPPPPPSFYFPCQLKHICPSLTTHPTPISIQLEPLVNATFK